MTPRRQTLLYLMRHLVYAHDAERDAILHTIVVGYHHLSPAPGDTERVTTHSVERPSKYDRGGKGGQMA